MKIPAIVTLLLAAVLSALPLSQARADDVSFDVFYNSLGDQGDWYNTQEYGYVWQPSIAYQNDKWRPYSDGYWAQTDDGWTWVSYENFGWATYHYGRWTNLADTGWVWVPGYEWGPGWVSWRTNDDYVGWAPIPPRRERTGNQSSGSSLTVDYNTVESEEGYDSGVDEQYDIGPDNYCFVENRYFAAPVLSAVILPPQRNILICENTINVTNIHYRRGGPRVVVFNQGPDFDFLSRRVDRPIQRLRIDRRDDIGFLRDGPRDRNPNVVRDGVFQIAAPNIARRPINFNEVRPTTIKRDIRDPRVEHGWRNTGADQQTLQRVRQQFQQQARERPTRPPGNPAAALVPPADPRQRDVRANVPPTPGAPGAPGFVPPADPRQRERDARNNAVPTPAVVPVAPGSLPRGNSDAAKRARRDAAQRAKDARANGDQPAPGAAPEGVPPVAPRNPPGQPNAEHNRGPKVPDVAPQPTAAPTVPKSANPNRDGRHTPRQPATTPATPQHEERPNQPPAEPKAAAPTRPTEEAPHAPRQPEHLKPAVPPVRNPASESAPERRPSRPQEPPQRVQPPTAPRPEVREQPQVRPQAPAAAPRPEVREQPQPRPQVREQPQPQAQPRPQVREQPQPQAQPRPQAPAAPPRPEAKPQPKPGTTAPDDKNKREN